MCRIARLLSRKRLVQAPTIVVAKGLVKSLGGSCPFVTRSIAAIQQEHMKILQQL